MTRRFVLGSGEPRERVDKVLAALLGDVSRATVQRWITEGRVRVNGAPCRPKDDVRGGSVIDVDPGPPPPTEVAPEGGVPFTVVFEDDAVIVVDKPAGVVVHPARGHWTGTLVAGLLSRPGFERAAADARDPMGQLRPGIVHRIDKDTSGVLVVAKTATAREGLKAQFAKHSVTRVYRALTLGVPPSGEVRSLHGRSPRSRLRFTSFVEEGRPAVTRVSVEERLAGGRAALVRCELETGRTHQIRVHLAERTRTPLLCDKLYGRSTGDPALAPAEAALGRQALHAGVLGFVHPLTGTRLTFEAPLPADMAAALALLRESR